MGQESMIAHIDDAGRIQTLEEHLKGTAQKASLFAEEFGCGKLGRLCGLFHDIGKYSPEFQARIRNPLPSNKVDHSTAGAAEAAAINVDLIVAGMAIAGHHSGLMDGGNAKASTAGDGTYFGRMKNRDRIPNYQAWEREDVLTACKEWDGPWCPPFAKEDRFSMSFFIRMLYSCLVDADYLDTEAFMRGTQHRGGYHLPERLREDFLSYIGPWMRLDSEQNRWEDEEQDANTKLCRCRNAILAECMDKGKKSGRGLYTLTVPTGGGKTTASLGFALQHVCAHGMKRIIYVIPYTSIIDQTAMVFEKIFGEENVVEHHSGILYNTDACDGMEDSLGYRKSFATENWDAPVIVTTAVQFFESLYGSKSSKCRKLHNLANSVIIFDEAQTLPVFYLKPCVAAIAQLVKNYGVTAVLCTATQPALERQFQEYLPDLPMQEICTKAQRFSSIFARTRIVDLGQVALEEFAEMLSLHEQVLCIVNQRKTAQELYHMLEGNGSYCLTTLLCPADRKNKIHEIRDRLGEQQRCVVIATSLVEAGVDLDFPVVYRQEAGLDSLIQAAGRCNREGKRPAEESMVYSFRLEQENSRFLVQNIAALQETWRRYDAVDTQEAIDFYFTFYRNLLGTENLDQKGILDAFARGVDGGCFPFATVDKRFRLIENNMRTVYLSLDDALNDIDQVMSHQADRNVFRRLGQYAVNVYESHFQELWGAGCLEEVTEGIFVLRDMHQYDDDTGLRMDVETGCGIMI